MTSIPANPEKLRLVFLGDSITVGDGDIKSQGWPARLCAQTSPHPTLTQCYNLGIGGDSIENLAHRTRSELAVRLAERTGRGVAIMIGVNDAIRAAALTNKIPLNVDGMTANIRDILRVAKSYGPVLVIKPAPVATAYVSKDGATGSGVMSQLRQINELLETVSASEGVPILALTDALEQDGGFMAALAAGDELHPAAEGYEIIAHHIARSSLWADFLAGVLRDV